MNPPLAGPGSDLCRARKLLGRDARDVLRVPREDRRHAPVREAVVPAPAARCAAARRPSGPPRDRGAAPAGARGAGRTGHEARDAVGVEGVEPHERAVRLVHRREEEPVRPPDLPRDRTGPPQGCATAQARLRAPTAAVGSSPPPRARAAHARWRAGRGLRSWSGPLRARGSATSHHGLSRNTRGSGRHSEAPLRSGAPGRRIPSLERPHRTVPDLFRAEGSLRLSRRAGHRAAGSKGLQARARERGPPPPTARARCRPASAHACSTCVQADW